jgi:hypothetical protein
MIQSMGYFCISILAVLSVLLFMRSFAYKHQSNHCYMFYVSIYKEISLLYFVFGSICLVASLLFVFVA